MMLAIYKGQVFRVGDVDDDCQLLDRTTGVEVARVEYGDEALLLDPTDAQVEAAENHLPIPPESCAVCHQNAHHDHEWHYRTPDGYGVCDDCGQLTEGIVKEFSIG